MAVPSTPEIVAQPTVIGELQWAVDWLDAYEGECMPEWREWAERARVALEVEQRLRDAAPALRDALKAAQAVDDHESDCMFCFHADPCGIRETLTADASAMRVAALAAAATPDAAEGGR